MDGREVDGWSNERREGWKGGWMDGWMDRLNRLDKFLSLIPPFLLILRPRAPFVCLRTLFYLLSEPEIQITVLKHSVPPQIKHAVFPL
jgi:hypothetical protein